jgi:hypothetical protein
VVVASIGEHGAIPQEPRESPREQSAKALQVVRPHLIDHEHDDQSRRVRVGAVGANGLDNGDGQREQDDRPCHVSIFSH